MSTLHTHILVLGFIFFILVLLLENSFKLSQFKSFKGWIITYNLGFVYLISTILYRGILQVMGSDFSGLSHIAGLGHAILCVSLIWFVFIVNKSIKQVEDTQKIDV